MIFIIQMAASSILITKDSHLSSTLEETCSSTSFKYEGIYCHYITCKTVSTFIRITHGLAGVADELKGLFDLEICGNIWVTNSTKILSITSADMVAERMQRLASANEGSVPTAPITADTYGNIIPLAVFKFIESFKLSDKMIGSIIVAGYELSNSSSPNSDGLGEILNSVAIGLMGELRHEVRVAALGIVSKPIIKWFDVLNKNITEPSSAARVFNLFRDHPLF